MDVLLDHGGALLYSEEEAGPDSPRRGLEVDISFCTDPACNLAHIDIFDAEISSINDTMRQPVTASVNVDSVEVDLRPTPAPGTPEADLARRFQALLQPQDTSLLKLIQRRFRYARGKEQDAWKRLDWRWWEPGLLVSHYRVFPDAPNIVFESGGERIWADDGYCISPGCPCNDVMLTFVKPDVLADGIAMEPFCALIVNVEDWTISNVDGGGQGPATSEQKRLWQDLRKARDGIRSELTERRQDLQRIAPRIRALSGNDPGPLNPAKARPGRNEPCHCGSGKKYKKCCLASDAMP